MARQRWGEEQGVMGLGRGECGLRTQVVGGEGVEEGGIEREGATAWLACVIALRGHPKQSQGP